MTNENSNFHMLMRQAVRNCVEEDFMEFRTGDVSDVTVHPRIRRKVKAAIRRMYLRSSVGWQILKRSVAACLVIVTVAFASAMCIQPVRAAFWNAIVTWYEDFIGIVFEKEPEIEYPSIIENRIFPELSDEWSIEVVSELDWSGLYIITGPNNENISYKQKVYTGTEAWYDNTECIVEMIQLNEAVEAYLCSYPQDDIITITWLDQYVFSITGENVTSELLIEIVKTIY